jgi:hypothetical protein
MCDSDNEDTPFYFELEVDDEISFKAPYMPAPKKIETSRKSFSMPQFALKNLASTSDRFKSTENDDPDDKENKRKSNSCQNTAEKAKRSNSNTAEKAKRSNCSTAEKPKLPNTAEKPRLPPSSAEKLLRYSMNSAVSFIENFSAMLPKDIPPFQTIEEGADESFEAPNTAEDCDLSEAELSAFKENNSCRKIPKNLSHSRSEFESFYNVRVSMPNLPDSNEEEQDRDRAVDLNASIRSEGSCQSYGTATGEELEDTEGLFSDSVASTDLEECSVRSIVCGMTSLAFENENGIIDQNMQIDTENKNENEDQNENKKDHMEEQKEEVNQGPKVGIKVAPTPLSALCPFPPRIVKEQQQKVPKNSSSDSYKQNAMSDSASRKVPSSKPDDATFSSDKTVTPTPKKVELHKVTEFVENKENFAPLIAFDAADVSTASLAVRAVPEEERISVLDLLEDAKKCDAKEEKEFQGKGDVREKMMNDTFISPLRTVKQKKGENAKRESKGEVKEVKEKQEDGSGEVKKTESDDIPLSSDCEGDSWKDVEEEVENEVEQESEQDYELENPCAYSPITNQAETANDGKGYLLSYFVYILLSLLFDSFYFFMVLSFSLFMLLYHFNLIAIIEI